MIHKGIRFANVKMLTMLGQTDPADTALAALSEDLDLSRSHLQHENREIHTAIESRCPGGSDHAADDHGEHEASFGELERLAGDVASATIDRPAKLRRLYQRFALFVAHDLEHMHEEETELQPLIVPNIPPAKMAKFLRVMLGGASPAERVAMITGMQLEMPAEVFSGMMEAVTGTSWKTGDWASLEKAVC